jgi:hypothetical protein
VISVDCVDFCRVTMRSPALQPVPCSSHGVLVSGRIGQQRRDELPLFPATPLPVTLRRGLCDYRFQSVATLLPVPPRVKHFVAGVRAVSRSVRKPDPAPDGRG